MEIAVLADDLTGANATGVKLSHCGFKTATVVRGLPLPDESHDALCIDTDSRYEPKETAQKRVTEALQIIHDLHYPSVYCKRVDSTLRGNIGAEIDAMLDYLGPEAVAVVVPAFPESGRVAAGDYLLVNNVPLQDTDVAKDPVSPLYSSRVSHLIAAQSNKPMASIGLDTVLQGREALAAQLQSEGQKGNRLLVVDAVTDEQIEMIANTLTHMATPVVAVDPGPLTAYYAQAAIGKRGDDKKILLTVGSMTSLTGQQLNELIDKWHVNPIYADPEKLASYSESWDREIENVVEKAAENLKNDNILLVTTHNPVQPLLNLKNIARQENAAEEALAKRITDGLAAISRKIIEANKNKISGCFLSGGDVTASVCAVSRAQGIKLYDEVLPLASYGAFIGGYLAGIPVVTKGGMIGDHTAISDCVRFLLNKLPIHQSKE